jgi:hypothetical protein
VEYLTPFDFFKITQALQLHFKKPDFNWFKVSAIRCSPKGFDTRKDARLYAYAASKIKAKDLVQFFLANLVDKKLNVVYNFDEAKQNFVQYTKKVASLSNYFKEDLNKIGNELEKMKKDVDKLFEVEYNRHPMIIKMFLSETISIETMILIDKFGRPFITEYDERFEKDIIWEKISQRLRKYSPFLDGKDWIVYDQSRVKMIWHDFVKDAELNLL